jgi:transcriptional regulator with XRE-family HTH domain
MTPCDFTKAQWPLLRRQALGLKIREVAKLMGCSASYVSDMERGRRQISIRLAAKWADALQVDRSEMLAWRFQQKLWEAGFTGTVKVTIP